MDQVIFVVLSALVLLGKFADFAIQQAARMPEEAAGPSGSWWRPDRRARPRQREEDGWLLRSIRVARRYLVELFGRNPSLLRRTGWARRAGRVFLVSAFFVQGTFVFSALIVPEAWGPSADYAPYAGITAFLLFLILSNFALDLVAVHMSIGYARAFELYLQGRRRGRDLAWRTARLVAVIYLSVITVMNASFFAMLVVQGAAAGYWALSDPWPAVDVWIGMFSTESVHRFLSPVAEGRHLGINGVNLIIFCVTPLLPPLLIAICAVSGAVLDGVDVATGGLARRMGRRFAREGRPIFLRIASALAILGAGAATLGGGG